MLSMLLQLPLKFLSMRSNHLDVVQHCHALDSFTNLDLQVHAVMDAAARQWRIDDFVFKLLCNSHKTNTNIRNSIFRTHRSTHDQDSERLLSHGWCVSEHSAGSHLHGRATLFIAFLSPIPSTLFRSDFFLMGLLMRPQSLLYWGTILFKCAAAMCAIHAGLDLLLCFCFCIRF